MPGQSTKTGLLECRRVQGWTKTPWRKPPSIRILQPGIVCLQERPHTNLLAGRGLGCFFPIIPIASSASREDEILNLAVFSRWPVGNVQEYYFRTATTKCFKRISGWQGKLSGYSMSICKLPAWMNHPQWRQTQTMRHPPSRRNRQADLLANAIAESRTRSSCAWFSTIYRLHYVYRKISRSTTGLSPGRPDMEGSYQRWGDFLRIDCALFTCIPKWMLPTGFQSTDDHKQQHCVALSEQTLLKQDFKND